jgi:hypothetical protein
MEVVFKCLSEYPNYVVNTNGQVWSTKTFLKGEHGNMLKSMFKKKPVIYMSHPVKGSNNDIQGNCEKAAAAARRLRRVFPEVEFYCPAESDLTLQLLTENGKIDIDAIMEVDLQILAACHGYMFYHFDESKGSNIEWDEAERLGIAGHPDTFEYNIEKSSYKILRKDFGPLVEDTVRRFRHGTKHTG